MAECKNETHRVIITNGIVVSGGKEQKSDILIENGRIVKTAQDIMLGSLLRRAESELLDAEGCYVFPGFIDSFTQVGGETCIEGQQESVCSSDDFESATKAALAGGTTSIINCAVQKKGKSLQDALNSQHASALYKSSCNYGFHIVITCLQQSEEKDAKELLEKTDGSKADPDESTVKPDRTAQENFSSENYESLTAQMEKMIMRGVSSCTIYMSGQNVRLSDAEIFEVLGAAKKHGMLVCCRCENGDMVQHLIEEQLKSRHKRPSAHSTSRPPAVEAEAIARFLSLAQLADIPVYILNVSAKQSLEQIKLAKKRGQKFFSGTCPHYLLLTDSLYRKGGFNGAKYICNPPLRKKQDLKALHKDIMRNKANEEPGAKDNASIDVICSDHSSVNFSQKEKAAKKNFSKVPAGLPGAQYRSTLIFTAAKVGEPDVQNSFPDTSSQNTAAEKSDNKELAPNFRLSPAQFSALMSENPAKIFGLYPDRGSLHAGAAADITVWDPSVLQTISVQTGLHNIDYSPYEGIQVKGQAKYVLLDGCVCVKDGCVVKEKQGRYLFRKASYPAFEQKI